MKRQALVYHDRPIFGFDLGTRTVKVMQLGHNGKGLEVLGYGHTTFPADAIVEGIVAEPEAIAKAMAPLLRDVGAGRITSRRVVAALPVAKVFTRVLDLPPMAPADVGAAVKLEAEQYVPVPLPDLYIDYEIIEQQPDHLEVLMVAAPRAIVDSYLKLFELMDLEVIALESSLSAVTRALVSAAPLKLTTLVADFGSTSIDLTVHDRIIRLTDTIALGGDSLTTQLSSKLQITHDQAHDIKVRFGLAKSGLQPKVLTALAAPLDTITGEMKRVLKYYASRTNQEHPVQTVMLAGGSASMPGLAAYLTNELRLPVTVAAPWDGLALHHVPAVAKEEAPMYTTALGLARLELTP